MAAKFAAGFGPTNDETFYGPFDTSEEADAYIDTHAEGDEAHRVIVIFPK